MKIAELKEALGTSSPIVKDECNDPNIVGTKGHVYVDGDGSYGPWFYVMAEGMNLKKRLSFMLTWQGECVYKLDRLPTEEEAAMVRKVVGLRKKKTLSAEHLEKLHQASLKYRFTARQYEAVI